jgi:hypothetical protein
VAKLSVITFYLNRDLLKEAAVVLLETISVLQSIHHLLRGLKSLSREQKQVLVSQLENKKMEANYLTDVLI